MPDPRMMEILRTKTPAEKIEMIFQANRTARALSAAGIRHYHPDWSDEQVHAQVARRFLAASMRDDLVKNRVAEKLSRRCQASIECGE